MECVLPYLQNFKDEQLSLQTVEDSCKLITHHDRTALDTRGTCNCRIIVDHMLYTPDVALVITAGDDAIFMVSKVTL